MTAKYSMTISRLTVDKLGVKLYDKVSAVIAELIANSYDADAETVTVHAPMGLALAKRVGSATQDLEHEIVVEDDGSGMTASEVNSFYLKVGGERRKDSRGDISKKFKRKVMGRKGVGKLAPFGICGNIEVITAGGDVVDGLDVEGKPAKGHVISHLILRRGNILTDSDTAYEPDVGAFDGRVLSKPGTTLRLTEFSYRIVPSITELERQLAQRFGIATANWKIVLKDSSKTDSDPDQTKTVGDFQVPLMENTRISLLQSGTDPKGMPTYSVLGPENVNLTMNLNGAATPLTAGFEFEGQFYPVTGWVAYAKESYRDDLMAGVRIYCRGKIAAQTNLFNRKSGFTGEYTVRSYLVGRLDADWLDEEEDLIQTDRRDILWSDELCQAFQRWGQQLVECVGTLSREPLKKRIWDRFEETSKIQENIAKAFPGADQEPIRARARELAKFLGRSLREDELDDKENVKSIVRLTLDLAPHLTLNDEMRKAADVGESPLQVLTSVLRVARIAELSAFGSIAQERVRVIRKVETLKDDPSTLEEALQDLLANAPWLINPQWAPVVANQSFGTLRDEFTKVYKERTGNDLNLSPFSVSNKRADFVMAPFSGKLEIVEIKKPAHKLTNDEVDRISNYVELMTEFLADPKHKTFTELFSDFHVTLVCDGLSVKGSQKHALDGFIKTGRLEHLDWRTFLLRTRQMHEQFLQEADRQRKDAAKGP